MEILKNAPQEVKNFKYFIGFSVSISQLTQSFQMHPFSTS